MNRIVRRVTGENGKEYVARPMKEEGVIEPEHEPSVDEVRRSDKARKDKKMSNQEWVSSTDSASRIAQRKDGRTHLAYKADHLVNLTSDLVLAAEIYPADRGDTLLAPEPACGLPSNWANWTISTPGGKPFIRCLSRSNR